MAKKKIIFQGEPGANSDLACRGAYPDYEPVPCPTFEDCFTALSSGDVDLGMIPIENSVAGRVADIHHLMPTSDLHIIADWFLPIRHQPMAPDGAPLAAIKSANSPQMATGQARTRPPQPVPLTVTRPDNTPPKTTTPLLSRGFARFRRRNFGLVSNQSGVLRRKTNRLRSTFRRSETVVRSG